MGGVASCIIPAEPADLQVTQQICMSHTVLRDATSPAPERISSFVKQHHSLYKFPFLPLKDNISAIVRSLICVLM